MPDITTPLEVRFALRPHEFAARTGICRASVYNMLARGELAAFKIGRATLIPVTELERLAAIPAATIVVRGGDA